MILFIKHLELFFLELMFLLKDNIKFFSLFEIIKKVNNTTQIQHTEFMGKILI